MKVISVTTPDLFVDFSMFGNKNFELENSKAEIDDEQVV